MLHLSLDTANLDHRMKLRILGLGAGMSAVEHHRGIRFYVVSAGEGARQCAIYPPEFVKRFEAKSGQILRPRTDAIEAAKWEIERQDVGTIRRLSRARGNLALDRYLALFRGGKGALGLRAAVDGRLLVGHCDETITDWTL